MITIKEEPKKTNDISILSAGDNKFYRVTRRNNPHHKFPIVGAIIFIPFQQEFTKLTYSNLTDGAGVYALDKSDEFWENLFVEEVDVDLVIKEKK